MNDVVEQYRSTALDSTYSREREQAMEKLLAVYDDVDVEAKQRVLETFREIARESTYSEEREQASEALRELFDRDPATAAPLAVRTFATLAREARHSERRRRAMDQLVAFHRAGVPEALSELILEALLEVTEEATREREREHARERLADLTGQGSIPADATAEDLSVDSSGPSGSAPGTGDAGYLAASLAEHFTRAAEESPEACLERAEELRDFLVDHQREGDTYRELLDELESLVEQLEVAPTGEELDESRKRQVERLASRIEGLYLRQ